MISLNTKHISVYYCCEIEDTDHARVVIHVVIRVQNFLMQLKQAVMVTFELLHGGVQQRHRR